MLRLVRGLALAWVLVVTRLLPSVLAFRSPGELKILHGNRSFDIDDVGPLQDPDIEYRHRLDKCMVDIDLANYKPQEERIVYYMPKMSNGIRDGLRMMTYLRKIAVQNNATVCISGGKEGATNFLTSKHSAVIHPSWEQYFDIDFAVCNSDITQKHSDCNTVTKSSENVDNLNMFENEVKCVNLEVDWYSSKIKEEINPISHPECYTRLSGVMCGVVSRTCGNVKDLFSKLLAANNLVKHEYGHVHIRRRDKILNNANCTKIEAVISDIRRFPEVKTWVVDYYASDKFKNEFRTALKQDLPDHRFVFEEEINIFEQGDQYTKALVMMMLQQNAAIERETHNCVPDSDKALLFCRGHLYDQCHQTEDDDVSNTLPKSTCIQLG
eukprot:jgi/Bigna1/78927/fgenesh1_pg.58_\